MKQVPFLFLLLLMLTGCLDIATPTLPPAFGTLPTATPIPDKPNDPDAKSALAEIQRRYDCAPRDDACQATATANKQTITYGNPRAIIRPEWQTLFPGAQFYLVPRTVATGDQVQQDNKLIVRYKEQWYEPGQFQHLMDAFDLQVTDDRRDLVARAFVTMRLANYLEHDLVLSDSRAETSPSIIPQPYDYTISVWTQLQGLKIRWRLMFDKGSLVTAGGEVTNQHLGAYIDEPFNTLPLPSTSLLEYWRGTEP